MDGTLESLLTFAGQNLFRFAFAVMVLGLIRQAALSLSDVAAAYWGMSDRSEFRRLLRLRLRWYFAPATILPARGAGGRDFRTYHAVLGILTLCFHALAIVVPIVMLEHVALLERTIGLSWPTLSMQLVDTLTITVVVLGVVVFLGRVYSPVLRSIEPVWSFTKPLILVAPFALGWLAMHPQHCPLPYDLTMLLHLTSGALVFVLVPFGRLLTCVHAPLTTVMPEAAWPTTALIPADAAATRRTP